MRLGKDGRVWWGCKFGRTHEEGNLSTTACGRKTKPQPWPRLGREFRVRVRVGVGVGVGVWVRVRVRVRVQWS